MNKKYIQIAGLFDLDGVIIDTETQYTGFWTKIMEKYRGNGSLAHSIKGSTLENIYDKWFQGQQNEQREITAALALFEKNMTMEYIPGLPGFIQSLKSHEIPCAIVTSSNKQKMEAVYAHHPELLQFFDFILTAEQFTRSKPAPDPYLLGAQVCQMQPENCFVFEDSFNGLASGRAAHMHVIGLATTNTAEAIHDHADKVISDFTEITYDDLFLFKQEVPAV